MNKPKEFNIDQVRLEALRSQGGYWPNQLLQVIEIVDQQSRELQEKESLLEETNRDAVEYRELYREAKAQLEEWRERCRQVNLQFEEQDAEIVRLKAFLACEQDAFKNVRAQLEEEQRVALHHERERCRVSTKLAAAVETLKEISQGERSSIALAHMAADTLVRIKASQEGGNTIA
ncbi:hypothetical protein [Paenibacillus elgii]|uniref:hypothetical protein n=1 Tax=Paenibacillus elgii TaxID=189691 RepID=UPI000248D3BB|nr:hypothetical protein [Paenibacillus elgii]